MICLGVESTAHTFSIGIAKDKEILANVRDMYVPAQGGINPLDAQQHHIKVKDDVLEEALNAAGVSLDPIDLVAYAAGPGLPPCLKVGAQFAEKISKKIEKPLIEVNHAVAHIEIGRLLCECKDPIAVYVSGGNTQIIGYASGRYRVFGETLDIPIGNAIDVFIRETYGKDDVPCGLKPATSVFAEAPLRRPEGRSIISSANKKAETFGGPILEKLAEGGNYTELPYVVKGMDLSFTGITTAAIQKYNQGIKSKNENERSALIRNLAFSFQETCFAMLTEVTERALAHTGKKEIVLVGGVAANKRFNEMIGIMCEERGAKAYVVPREFSGDQGAMIGWTGLLAYKNGQKPVKKADFNPVWRADQVEISWMK